MADTKILLDCSMRSNDFAKQLLLENTKHGQILQDKSAACEWITTSNKLLNSHKDRWMGLIFLDCLVEQCGTELFNENCLLWLKTLLQIIQQEKEDFNVCKYVAEVLEKIFPFSVQFSEISREISLTVIPSLLSTVLSEKNMNPEVSLPLILTCIQHYPAASASFVRRIENLILKVFDADKYSLIQNACSCFAILPRCGSSSGTGLDKQAASWETQWKKVLSTLSTVTDEFYIGYKTGSTYQVKSEALQLKSIPVVEPQRTETCVLRFKCMFKCLDLMLRNEFSKYVNVPVESTIKIIEGIFAVSGKSIRNDIALESVLLKSNFPAVHLSAIEFLSTLILTCGMSLLPYHVVITQMLLLELSWSECEEKTLGLQQNYSQLRSAVYDCVQYLIHVTSTLGASNDKIKKILRHVIEDVKPRVTVTKLLAPAASTSTTSTHGKKAKRKRIQDDVSQLNRPEQKTDYRANRELCLSGLKVLNTAIVKGGSDVPSDVVKELQVLVVTLLLQCQQVSKSKPQCNYPIPYSCPDCRKMLYNILQSCLYNHNPKTPPPLQHAIVIFSQGTRDQDLENHIKTMASGTVKKTKRFLPSDAPYAKPCFHLVLTVVTKSLLMVSKFCTEAQMMCHVLIHPRVAIFSSSINHSKEQEIADRQDCVTGEDTHMNRMKDGRPKVTNGSSKEENTCSMLQKSRDSNDSTTSFRLANVANGNIKSKNGVANTNKDTSELVRETQHNASRSSKTPQHMLGLGKETNQYNEPVIPLADEDSERVHKVYEENIAEQYETMKRPLSKRFEKYTNELTGEASEVIEDTIPAVKRRKVQEETSSSNFVEDVSNNNDENKISTKRSGKEKLESVEDKLVEEMINSFVDSVPD